MDKQTLKRIPAFTDRRVNRTLARVDEVLLQNSREKWLYISLVILLFLAGITCLILAIVDRRYGWSIPPVITTALLHWPLKAIRDIRRKNVALAIAPELISMLPAREAAAEIKKLLRTL